MDFSNIVADIDLKIETVSSYQEQFINEINLKLLDIITSVQRHQEESCFNSVPNSHDLSRSEAEGREHTSIDVNTDHVKTQ